MTEFMTDSLSTVAFPHSYIYIMIFTVTVATYNFLCQTDCFITAILVGAQCQ